MDITQNQYPDFPTESTLEELTLNMARTLLDLQKAAATNPNGEDKVDMTTNEETDSITINISGLEARFDNAGKLTVVDYLQYNAFQTGTGSYPFNRENIVDALFHLVVYQHKMELDPAINSNGTLFLEWVAESSDVVGRSNSIEASITMTDYRVTNWMEGGSRRSKAKTYLSNLS